MKILGTFVGINKHSSNEINELTSAVKDAQALWALFSDTFKDINAELLVNESAIAENVKKSLERILLNATNDDVAILSFSGHGTRSHRLVCYDTSKEQIDSTTISMSFLSDLFKKSKAKVIICILDCCFSGGAPAKVFEDTPASRDIHSPYEQLQGKGRILIAASNESQPAWERAGVGHGLLTEAILKIFRSSDDEIDVTQAIYKVVEMVQTEAIRIGETQTPVVASLVEGGLRMPSLREGSNYNQLFPKIRSHIVTNEISDLLAFGIPDSVITEWKSKYVNGLNDLQLKAVNEFKIFAAESLLVVAPTSSGKTFVGEMAAIKAIAEGRKAVFLLPYRALVNEKYQQFKASYEDNFSLRVIRCSGDYSDQASSFLKGQYDLAILTFEMFLNLIVANPKVLSQIGLVVLDEAQFITDPNRGISVELLLTCIITARKNGIAPQVIALSAVIGDVNKFDNWLGVRLLYTKNRPIPLIEGVIDRMGIFQFVDTDGSVKEENFLDRREIQQRKKDPSAQDVLVPLLKKLTQNKEKIIVFRNMRGNAQGSAKYLANDLGLPSANSVISKLPIHDQSGTSQTLRECLNGGTAFHTSNLSKEEREVIENSFRDKNGGIEVLCATTTVAAGINTPASTVIIAEQEFMGEDGRSFTISEYKNMAGRAGRLGFSEIGKSIIYAENSFSRRQLFQKYVLGKIEDLKSSFDTKELNTWVIRLLGQIKVVPKGEIVNLLANTYGGYLALTRDVNWLTKMEVHTNQLIERMITLGLLEEEEGAVRLTLLGRSCANSALKFESSLRLVELVRKFSSTKLDALTMVALVQILKESDEVYISIFKRGQGESKHVQSAQNKYGRAVVSDLQRYVEDQFAYYGRCKKVAILFDWMNGEPIENIEKNYTYTPFQGAIHSGDIRRVADSTRYYLRSAYQIAIVVSPNNICSELEFETLIRQLEFGIPSEVVELINESINLTRGELIAIYNAGFVTKEMLLKLSLDQLVNVLGSDRGEQIHAEIVRLQ